MKTKKTESLTHEERIELFRIYDKLRELKSDIESSARRSKGWKSAKAYWFASLSSAINDEEYVTGGNPTFKSFLIDEGVMDKDENFIEEDWDDEDEPDDLECDCECDCEGCCGCCGVEDPNDEDPPPVAKS